MRPVNLNASRPRSERAMTDDWGNHFFSGKIFQGNLSPLTLASLETTLLSQQLS